MAIDPDVLARQRIGPELVVPPRDRALAPCSKCGTPTRAKAGICRACKNGYGLRDVTTLTTAQIASYITALRTELKRRRDELDAALEEP